MTKKDWSEVEACIYESDKDVKVYFKLYSDKDRTVREIKKSVQLQNPIVVLDYNEEGNIIGVEILGDK